MTYSKIVIFSLIGAAAAIALIGQQSASEAPAGFTTPTLGQMVGPTGELVGNAGSQSVSNGIAEPPGDTFALDQAQFERRHDASTGLVACPGDSVTRLVGREERFPPQPFCDLHIRQMLGWGPENRLALRPTAYEHRLRASTTNPAGPRTQRPRSRHFCATAPRFRRSEPPSNTSGQRAVPFGHLSRALAI